MTALRIPFQCGLCHREYKLKICYDKHIVICDALSKSTYMRKKELEQNTSTIPSTRDLYALVLHLVAKNDQLEKRVDEMSKWVDTKKRKLHITEWLNEKYPKDKINMPFESWLEYIKSRITLAHLEMVFNSDFVSGAADTLYEIIRGDSDNNTPIKAFDQKDNTLYVFIEAENSWTIMLPEQVNKLGNILMRRLMGECANWRKENAVRFQDEAFSKQYTSNVRKLMGGNLPSEQLFQHVKKKLYKHIKVNLYENPQMELEF